MVISEMEGCLSRKEEVCPQLLDLIPKSREWLVSRGEERSHGSSEEKKLELRLGPPGEDWSLKAASKSNRERDESLLSLGYFSSIANVNISNNINGNQTHKCSSSDNPVGSSLTSPWASSGYHGKIQHTQQQPKAPSFLQFPSTPQSLPVIGKEGSQTSCTKVVDLQNAEKKAFSPPSANTAVPNSSQKRYSSFFTLAMCFSSFVQRIFTHRFTLFAFVVHAYFAPCVFIFLIYLVDLIFSILCNCKISFPFLYCN